MTARVLLVTGSRALSATPQAEAWARAELVKRITLAVERVVTTPLQAPDNWTKGPTEWVEEMASDSIVVTRWSLRGSVDYRIAGRMTAGWWWLSGSAKPPPTWHDLRYARDAACMAQTATTLDASVLVFDTSWWRDHYTQHTMRLAREHGLPVEVLTCPEAYGPRGSR